jgi:hypothetical protein
MSMSPEILFHCPYSFSQGTGSHLCSILSTVKDPAPDTIHVIFHQHDKDDVDTQATDLQL